jgi:hypothetical protein
MGGASKVEEMGALGVVELERPGQRASSTPSETPLRSPRSKRV